MNNRLIDRRVPGWKSEDLVQKLVVVGEYGVLERDPVKAHQAEKYHDRVRSIIEHQLAMRGDSKSFTFKAFGFRWVYKPGASS